jgi:hypothetical protein
MRVLGRRSGKGKVSTEAAVAVPKAWRQGGRQVLGMMRWCLCRTAHTRGKERLWLSQKTMLSGLTASARAHGKGKGKARRRRPTQQRKQPPAPCLRRHRQVCASSCSSSPPPPLLFILSCSLEARGAGGTRGPWTWVAGSRKVAGARAGIAPCRAAARLPMLTRSAGLPCGFGGAGAGGWAKGGEATVEDALAQVSALSSPFSPAGKAFAPVLRPCSSATVAAVAAGCRFT